MHSYVPPSKNSSFKRRTPTRKPMKKETTAPTPPAITFPPTLNTYLGKKGYTILKSELSKEQQDFIVDKLTIKPFML